MAEKKTVDIADFFTTSNEKEGTWFEPEINGAGIGIEFKILGLHSDEVIVAADLYDKAVEKAEAMKDSVEKVRKLTEARIDRVSSCVVGIRGKDGVVPVIKGEPLAYSRETVKEILSESTELCTEILSASINSENFMKKKN